MVTQLGRTLCCEEGILRRSIDTHRNGWKRVLWSHQCWYSQEVLCLRPPKEGLVRIENLKGQFWQKKKEFKVKTRKGSLNHKKKWEMKKWKWEVKLKTWKGGLSKKRIPRLKTWKGGLGRRKSIKSIQRMESCDDQASLVCGKADFWHMLREG